MTGVALKVSPVLSTNILPYLISNGFIEQKSFTKAGILFVESKELTVSGAFGSNVLQIKCKVKDCSIFLNSFEELLSKMV